MSFLDSAAAPSVDHAWVRVIEERPLSLALADRVAVPHESPQALLIRDGAAVWNASHRAITAQSLEQAIQAAAGA